ncbi:MAG TPA: DUF962 domain-containing protein, partial [Lysobacter sp.]|nr:DUF962 domain-containing protein [Lysobacter sp.]
TIGSRRVLGFLIYFSALLLILERLGVSGTVLWTAFTGFAAVGAVALVQAYAFAWVGHFFFERNRPATFQYPLLSLRGDWRMWWEMLTGKIRF